MKHAMLLLTLVMLAGCSDPARPPLTPDPYRTTVDGETIEVGRSYLWVDPADPDSDDVHERIQVSQTVHVMQIHDTYVVGQHSLRAPIDELWAMPRYADTGEEFVPGLDMVFIWWEYPAWDETTSVRVMGYQMPRWKDGEWVVEERYFPGWDGKFYAYPSPDIAYMYTDPPWPKLGRPW